MTTTMRIIKGSGFIGRGKWYVVTGHYYPLGDRKGWITEMILSEHTNRDAAEKDLTERTEESN